MRLLVNGCPGASDSNAQTVKLTTAPDSWCEIPFAPANARQVRLWETWRTWSIPPGKRRPRNEYQNWTLADGGAYWKVDSWASVPHGPHLAGARGRSVHPQFCGPFLITEKWVQCSRGGVPVMDANVVRHRPKSVQTHHPALKQKPDVRLKGLDWEVGAISGSPLESGNANRDVAQTMNAAMSARRTLYPPTTFVFSIGYRQLSRIQRPWWFQRRPSSGSHWKMCARVEGRSRLR